MKKLIFLILSFCLLTSFVNAQTPNVKITVLSTMITDLGISVPNQQPTHGEWGYAALVEVNGKRILFDTGRTPGLVLENARILGIDLSDIEDVVLSHFHYDHTGGFMDMRRKLMAKNPNALSRLHINDQFFNARQLADGTPWPMEFTAEEYEATGGEINTYSEEAEILPGVWLSGPVARSTDEQNRPLGVVMNVDGQWIEDIVPDSMSLFIETPEGTIVITGCGHAGLINITREASDVTKQEKLHAVMGGLHLFAQPDERLKWTADELLKGNLDYFMGAHCTGVEATITMRRHLGGTRQSVVNGAVGSTFTYGEGIYTPPIAR